MQKVKKNFNRKQNVSTNGYVSETDVTTGEMANTRHTNVAYVTNFKDDEIFLFFSNFRRRGQHMSKKKMQVIIKPGYKWISDFMAHTVNVHRARASRLVVRVGPPR